MILDWVPAHFPRDDFALARFDGTALYEHADPRRGAHPDWGTLVFNYGRNEVRNFLARQRALLAARVPRRRPPRRRRRLDALPRLLAQGGRVGAERVRRPRGPRGGRVPQGAERGRCTAASPGVISAAEESTAWPGVSRPTYLGGLGFGFKWNMGWMHDTLDVLPAGPDPPPLPPPRADVLARVRVHARTSSCRSPTTRSCTARARCSTRCPATAGSSSRTCARCTRYMWAHPGKKLLFMGGEFAQEARVERTSARSTGTCSRTPTTPASRRSCATSTARYRDEPALWEIDFEPARASGGSRPTTPSDNVLAFARRAQGRRARARVASATSRRCRATATGSACRAPGRWRRGAQHRLDATTAAPTSATSAASRPSRSPWHDAAVLGRAHAAAARRALARARGAGTGEATRAVSRLAPPPRGGG